MSILNGTLQTPADALNERKTVHLQTSTDQTVVNEEVFSVNSQGVEKGFVSKNAKNPTTNVGDVTKVIESLCNTGGPNSNTVVTPGTGQPGHSCLWFRRGGNTTTPVSQDLINNL